VIAASLQTGFPLCHFPALFAFDVNGISGRPGDGFGVPQL